MVEIGDDDIPRLIQWNENFQTEAKMKTEDLQGKIFDESLVPRVDSEVTPASLEELEALEAERDAAEVVPTLPHVYLKTSRHQLPRLGPAIAVLVVVVRAVAVRVHAVVPDLGRTGADGRSRVVAVVAPDLEGVVAVTVEVVGLAVAVLVDRVPRDLRRAGVDRRPSPCTRRRCKSASRCQRLRSPCS